MKATALKQIQYDPSVFKDVETVDEAVKIILTPEGNMSSAQRWKAEAPFLMGLIKRFMPKPSLVLDYGCGIGRLAKPMIELLDCQVLGVDISPNMLALACSCVASERFAAMSPFMLARLSRLAPRCCDAAISVWTLQHVLALEQAVAEIRDALLYEAPLFVVNNKNRVVPSDHGWLDDGKDVHRTILDSGFELIERGELEGDDIAPGSFADNTFWAAYRKA